MTLALEHGWNPKRTKATNLYYGGDDTPTHCLDWGSSYFWNSYQVIEADDAANIAEALERAMYKPTDPELNNDSSIEIIEEFIELCRAGSFHIG